MICRAHGCAPSPNCPVCTARTAAGWLTPEQMDELAGYPLDHPLMVMLRAAETPEQATELARDALRKRDPRMALAIIQFKNADHLDAVRATMPDMPPEQRVFLFKALAGGYCVACGEATTGTCHCENDE